MRHDRLLPANKNALSVICPFVSSEKMGLFKKGGPQI